MDEKEDEKILLLGTGRVSSGGTVGFPKEVREKMEVQPKDSIGYYEKANGEIVIMKMGLYSSKDIEKLVKGSAQSR